MCVGTLCKNSSSVFLFFYINILLNIIKGKPAKVSLYYNKSNIEFKVQHQPEEDYYHYSTQVLSLRWGLSLSEFGMAPLFSFLIYSNIF